MPELFIVAYNEQDFQPQKTDGFPLVTEHIILFCSKGLKINLPIQFFKKLDNYSYRQFKHWWRGFVYFGKDMFNVRICLMHMKQVMQCVRSMRLQASELL